MVFIPPGSTLGRYRLIEQLGRGGMGTVFRCHDPNLDRHVAVKVLPSYSSEDASFGERFTREAQTIASLSHPNILQIYDFGEDKGYSYIVTEMIHGGTLADRLTGTLPFEEVLGYVRPLAQALDYAHGEGVVHRDLKPANVLLTENGRPILADFGLALMQQSATRFTQANQVLGTPEYMSPEQVMGGDADHRSDLYAFGILLYQMILGQVPFRADTPAAILMAHVQRPLPPPTSINPDLDREVDALLLKALSKEPDERFQSASELVSALETATGLGGAAPTGVPASGADDALYASPSPGTASATNGGAASRTQRSPKALAAKAALLGGGVLAVVLVIGVLAFLLGQRGSDGGAIASPAAAVPVSGTPLPVPIPAAAPPGLPTSETPCPPQPEIEGGTSLPPAELAESQLKQMQNRVHTHVAALRGIREVPAVEAIGRTRLELCDLARGFYRRPDARDRIFEVEELYKTLGLVPEALSLERTLLEIQLQRALALFDDLSGNVYVLNDAPRITPQLEVGYASAYMRGLQQELFGVTDLRSRAGDGNSDHFRAVRALIFGDVAVLVKRYQEEVVARDDRAMEELMRPLAEDRLLAAPAIVQKATHFPLLEGALFVEELRATTGGWTNVDQAYQDPPESTEQVLHPAKYFGGETPLEVELPDISGRLSGRWSLTSVDTLGEYLLRSYLEEQLEQREAAKAASGWGGDRYLLMNNPDKGRLLVARIRFDWNPEAQEFIDAFRIFMRSALPAADTRWKQVGEAGRLWSAAGRKAVYLGESLPEVVLIVGDDAGAVEEAALELQKELAKPDGPSP